MKNFLDFIKQEEKENRELIQILESNQASWNKDLEEKLDLALDEFIETHTNENGELDIKSFDYEMLNEGILGSILGGLTGFALGKAVGKTICRVLNIQKGVLYDMLTSRLVGAALGAALGKRI